MNIRACTSDDIAAIWDIINLAAESYRGLIPAERSFDPYMPRDELDREIERGVEFWGVEQTNTLLGVMGLQAVAEVTLIRHAYTHPDFQRRGVGTSLLEHLIARSERPVLIGTWAGAAGAIRFYERHGFRRVPQDQIITLLQRYWQVPKEQMDGSVVLSNVDVDRLAS